MTPIKTREYEENDPTLDAEETIKDVAQKAASPVKKRGKQMAGKVYKRMAASFKESVASLVSQFGTFLAEGGWIPCVAILIVCILSACFFVAAEDEGEHSDMVAVAHAQLGNQGGEPYWKWYGYDHHVNWCACFVSFCGDQCGYIEKNRMPKFASCEKGMQWFIEKGVFLPRGQFPKPGDLIFFDWREDGLDGNPDHVGIVARIENETIYTIEGNVEDKCVQKSYHLKNVSILGYGILQEGTEENTLDNRSVVRHIVTRGVTEKVKYSS